MKAKILFTLVTAGVLMTSGLEWTHSSRFVALGGATTQAGPRQIDIGFFYEELAPYGYWSRHEPYGWVWYPADVDDEWRPYTVGHWVFTNDYGWTWVSEEPWGWMTYHYGRWFYDSDYGGWAWIPGTVWGPAWVSWRSGEGVVGWAPLPPEVHFDPVAGFSQPSANFQISWFAWSFVSEPELLSHRVHRSILPRPRNRAMIDRTRHFTDYKVIDRRIVNRGIDIDRYERDHRTRVTRYRAIDVDRPTVKPGSTGEGSIPLFRPRVLDRGEQARPPESAVASPSAVRRGDAVPRNFRNETPSKEGRGQDRPDTTDSHKENRPRPPIEQTKPHRENRPQQIEQPREIEPSQLPEVQRESSSSKPPPEQRREREQPPEALQRGTPPSKPPPEQRHKREQPPEALQRGSPPSKPPPEQRREREQPPEALQRGSPPSKPPPEQRREREQPPETLQRGSPPKQEKPKESLQLPDDIQRALQQGK